MRISDWSSDVCSSDLGASRQLRSHDALACSLKAVAVARVVLCCDGATARQCAAATDARLHFPSRSCWIDAADPDHCKNRTRRPLSLTGVARSEQLRVGKAWVSMCRSRGRTYH